MVQRGGDPHGQVECHGGIRRLEQTRRVERTAVVGNCLVVGVGVLGVLSGSNGQLQRAHRVAERQRQAGVPGLLGLHPRVVEGSAGTPVCDPLTCPA